MWALWILIGLAGFYLLAMVLVSLPFLRTTAGIFEETPLLAVHDAPPCEEAERVTCETSDGVTLSGGLHRPLLADGSNPKGLILFFHELGGSHWLATEYAGGLIEDGFAVLAFDFRAQGESGGNGEYKPVHWITQKEVADVEAMMSFISGRDDLRDLPLGIIGVSRGGSAALLGLARSDRVRAIACDSAFTVQVMMEHYAHQWARLYVPRWLMRLIPRWQIRITLRLARWWSRWKTGNQYVLVERSFRRIRNGGKPVLMIGGRKDSYVKPAITQTIAGRLGENCDLWLVANAKHNGARQAASDEYDRRLREHFAKIT